MYSFSNSYKLFISLAWIGHGPILDWCILITIFLDWKSTEPHGMTLEEVWKEYWKDDYNTHKSQDTLLIKWTDITARRFSCPEMVIKILAMGTSLVVQWLRLLAPKCRGPLIPGQGTGSHMPELQILHATVKTQCSQVKTYKFLKN